MEKFNSFVGLIVRISYYCMQGIKVFLVNWKYINFCFKKLLMNLKNSKNEINEIILIFISDEDLKEKKLSVRFF